MVPLTKDNGTRVKFKGVAYINTVMVEYIKVNGDRI
jgi:hypothetical protein